MVASIFSFCSVVAGSSVSSRVLQKITRPRIDSRTLPLWCRIRSLPDRLAAFRLFLDVILEQCRYATSRWIVRGVGLREKDSLAGDSAAGSRANSALH